MEGDEAEALLPGKLDPYAPSPIWMGCRDEDLCFIDDEARERDGVGASHQSIDKRRECREK